MQTNNNLFTHDSKLNIYQRLILCMQDLRYIQRDGKIDKSYSFVSHDQITRVCTDAFIKYGIYPRVHIIKEALEVVTVKKHDNYTKKDYERTEYVASVQAIYELINIDNPEEKVMINAYGQGQDNQDKAFGKAISYACKYALLKGLGIETGDDPDKDADFSSRTQPVVQKTAVKKPVNETKNTYTIDETEVLPAVVKTIIEGMIQLITDHSGLDYYKDWRSKNSDELARFAKAHPDIATDLKLLYARQLENLPIIREDEV